MPTAHHAPGAVFIVAQLAPLVIVGVIYAVAVFVVARKRQVYPWGWTIGALIPLAGFLVALTFFVATILSILDRLDSLETRRAG